MRLRHPPSRGCSQGSGENVFSNERSPYDLLALYKCARPPRRWHRDQRPPPAPTPVRGLARRSSKSIIDAINPLPTNLDVYGIIAPGDVNHPETDVFKGVRDSVSWQKHIELAGSMYFINMLIPIIFTLIWIYLMIYVQIPLGILEVILFWFLNPWWDLMMLTGFAWANAAWQSCAMCDKAQCGGECGCAGK